jgi:cell wall-associated NlpC family hydrolase
MKDQIERVLWALAVSYLGKPYKWGGDDPIEGVDCSGLVQEFLERIGAKDYPGDYTGQQMFTHYRSRSEPQRQLGSIIFYGKSVDQITHVGMFLTENYIIHAGGGGSKTKTLKDAADQNAFVKIRPFDYRKDIVAILRPNSIPARGNTCKRYP